MSVGLCFFLAALAVALITIWPAMVAAVRGLRKRGSTENVRFDHRIVGVSNTRRYRP